jgi:hypothetical protein
MRATLGTQESKVGSDKMKKALRSYLLNLSKQLRLITAQQFIKEKTTKNEKKVLALLVVPKQVTFIFSNIQKDDRFKSLGHLRNPILYHMFMLIFGFVIRNTLKC